MQMEDHSIGLITTDEKKELELLFERDLALNELMTCISNDLLNKENLTYLKDKIKHDLDVNNNLYNNWWVEKSKKYNWLSKNNCSWQVNFKTNEVFLIVKS